MPMHLRRPFRRAASAPLLFLLAALATVFVFGNDRGRFYRPGHHDQVSASHLSFAVNLSPAHRFLMFRSLNGVEGEANRYNLYNRLPVGSYALIALTTAPFRGDLSLRLHAARLLMLGFFAAAAVMAYLAVSRLAGQQSAPRSARTAAGSDGRQAEPQSDDRRARWTALTATLLAFSSFHALYYSDVIASEVMPSLFGVLLTFHGGVVFLQEGRFRQLLVKTCVALLLGWHVLALVTAFVVLGLARELRARVSPSFPPPDRPRPRHCLTLGAVALLFFAALLTFNLGNEYAALDGRQAWTDLPSVRSLQNRTGFNPGFNERYADQLAWRTFLVEQFRRTGALSVPWAFSARLLRGFEAGQHAHPPLALGIGAAMTAAALAVLPFVRGWFPAAVLVLSGFAWYLPMRNHAAFHDFVVLFYIGIPLVVFAAAAAGLRRLAGDRAAVGLSAAALAVFVLSSHDMSGVGHDAESAENKAALMADFENIRRMTAGQPVYLPHWAGSPQLGGSPFATHYYLAGSVLYHRFDTRPRPCHPGFVVIRERVAGAAPLTPDNSHVFLYDRGDYDRNTLHGSGPPDAPRARTDCRHLARPAVPRRGGR